MVKVIILRKAENISNHEPVPARITIGVEEPLPDFSGWTDGEVSRFYDTEAQMLAEALYDSLPQATMERLLVKMLTRAAGTYRGVR